MTKRDTAKELKKEAAVLKGQEDIGEMLREHVAKFFNLEEARGKEIMGRIFHAYDLDGKAEIIKVQTMPGMSEQEEKDYEAEIIRKYCQNRHPSAIAMITEAWVWMIKFRDGEPRDQQYVADHYAELKSRAQRQEKLVVTLETHYGQCLYSWGIIRDGKSRRLSEVDIAVTEGKDPNDIGRYSGLLARPDA